MSKIVTLETKVSPRAMEAAMIAKLIKDLLSNNPSAVVQQMVWRHEQLGEILMDRPRAHPSFTNASAALMRLEQFIDRLLYGERFVPDKNPLIRISNAQGMVCDLSLESFTLSALGDDGVMMLQFGRSEMPPGSRSALELKEVGRFALFHQPSVLLRRQQALLPMREIMDSRKRHQELLEQQRRKAEEQELLATQKIETILGSSVPQYVEEEPMEVLSLGQEQENVQEHNKNKSNSVVVVNKGTDQPVSASNEDLKLSDLNSKSSSPLVEEPFNASSVLDELESAFSKGKVQSVEDPGEHALDGLLELKAQLEINNGTTTTHELESKKQTVEVLPLNIKVSDKMATSASVQEDNKHSESTGIEAENTQGSSVKEMLDEQLDSIKESNDPSASKVNEENSNLDSSTTMSQEQSLESPNPLADSNPIVLEKAATLVQEQVQKPILPSVSVIETAPKEGLKSDGWHQILFSIDVAGLSGFLLQVDHWHDYELKLTIKDQKVQMELAIPRGQLADVSPIISKFKVGPIILKPKRIV